jgi:2-methylcitrate dehydratase PrpD
MIGTSYSDLHKIMNANLGAEYVILENTFKPYPCCRLIHSSIDAVLDVVNENGIDLSDIEKILIKTISPLNKPTFSAQQDPDPENMTAGQSNAPYAITCALRNIEPPDWYKRENMLDKTLLAFANKIKFEADLDADKLFRKDQGTIPATAILYLKNGKEYFKEVLIPKGDPRNPLTLEDLTKKFRRLASKALDNEFQVMSLINMIMNLEKLEDVNELTKMLLLKTSLPE